MGIAEGSRWVEVGECGPAEVFLLEERDGGREFASGVYGRVCLAGAYLEADVWDYASLKVLPSREIS